MDTWKKHIRNEYLLPCLTMFVVFMVGLIFHETQLFINYPAIHSIIEAVGNVSFVLCLFCLSCYVNLSYLMNNN